MKRHLILFTVMVLTPFAALRGTEKPPQRISTLIEQSCADCHDAKTTKGKLDLTAVPFDLADPKNRERWVQVFDRVAQNEMPPDPETMSPEDRKALLAALEPSLHAASAAATAPEGRGPMRRLNRIELGLFRSPGWPYAVYPKNIIASTTGEYRVRFSARSVRQQNGFVLSKGTHPVPMVFRARKPSNHDIAEAVRVTGGMIDVQPEGGQRLLDRTMILYGSNLGDANIHDNTNLPILLAGGGLRHGQHLAFKRNHSKPLCNLFVTMLQNLGVETDSFGTSAGTLNELNSA